MEKRIEGKKIKKRERNIYNLSIGSRNSAGGGMLAKT